MTTQPAVDLARRAGGGEEAEEVDLARVAATTSAGLAGRAASRAASVPDLSPPHSATRAPAPADSGRFEM